MQQYKVAICRFPGGGVEHPDIGDWLADTRYKMRQDPRICGVGNWRKSDTPITMVRNCAVKETLAQGADYILMIDNDMGPDYLVGNPGVEPFWDVAWEFMMARRARELQEQADSEARLFDGITEDDNIDAAYDAQDALDEELAEIAKKFPPATIAAPYCGPPPAECPYIFRWKTSQSDHPDPDFKLAMIEREDAAIQTGIEQVAALPTGLILYDARVFKILDPPWFEYEYEDPPFNTAKASTEDVFQTRNASLIGLPQFVAWDCWAIHHKSKAVKKPVILTIDAVRDQLREHLLHGRKTGERINHVHPDYVAAQSRLAAARARKEADAGAKPGAFYPGAPGMAPESLGLGIPEVGGNGGPGMDQVGGEGSAKPARPSPDEGGRSIEVLCEENLALSSGS
jgi:hypothetical protein